MIGLRVSSSHKQERVSNMTHISDPIYDEGVRSKELTEALAFLSPGEMEMFETACIPFMFFVVGNEGQALAALACALKCEVLSGQPVEAEFESVFSKSIDMLKRSRRNMLKIFFIDFMPFIFELF